MVTTEFLTAVPVIPVRDIQASTSWYRDKLGFKVFVEEQDYGIVGSGEAWIHFCGPSEVAPETRRRHTRVGVRGIEELYAACEAHGIVHPNATLGETPWGFREFSVADLDENLVTFFEPPAGYQPSPVQK